VDGEVHYTDSLEDKLALSDRFGLWLSFYPPSWETYLAMVDILFENVDVNQAMLHEQAKQFAMRRASHSGRTAVQFYRQFLS